MSHYLRINTDSGFDKPQHGQESGICTLEGTVTREFLAERQSTPIEPKTLFYTILSKYISQESIDQAWQEIKEAGIFR